MSWHANLSPPISRHLRDTLFEALASACTSLTIERDEQRLVDDALLLTISLIESSPATVKQHLVTMGITRPTALKNLRELRACGYATHVDAGWLGTELLLSRVLRETRGLTDALVSIDSLFAGANHDRRAQSVMWGYLRTELWARRGFSPLAGARNLGFFHLIHSCAKKSTQTAEQYETVATEQQALFHPDTLKRWIALEWIDAERDRPIRVNPLGLQIAENYANQFAKCIQYASRQTPSAVAELSDNKP